MDVKRHAPIYDELLKLNIEINFHDTPTPAYIQEKIIQCNNYQIKTERYFIEVTRDLAIAERMFSTERLNISTLKTSLITNNETIKKLPTGKEREAAADEMLESNRRELLKLENDVNDLKSILSAIKQKQTTLKNTNNDIKSLQKLMEQMVNRMNIGHPDDPDVKELAGALSEIDKLEEEFELDNVESSIEESQSDDVDVTSEDSSVAIDTEDSISLDEIVMEDESEKLGDDPQSEPEINGNHEDGSQSFKDFEGPSGKLVAPVDEISPEPLSTDPPREDHQDADGMEDELASLLSDDDSSEVFGTEDDESEKIEEESTEVDTEDLGTKDMEEPEQGLTEESLPDNESADISLDLDEMSGISIDDDIESEVESKVTEPPKVEVDLGDLGIDLDIGGISAPEPKKSAPSTKDVKRTNDNVSVKSEPVKKGAVKTEPAKAEPVKTEPVKADVKKENTTVQKAPAEAKKADVKKEDPPVQKAPAATKKAEVLDIDLNDLLNSL